MATTYETIAQYLDRRDWSYELDSANEHIITGVQAENVERFLIVIKLNEGGKFLQVYAPQLLQVKNQVYQGVLFKMMAVLSWEYKLLRLQYDPTDGEVQASMELPLIDAELTEQQFNFCLDTLIQIVDQEAMPRMLTILATGEDPGQKRLVERFLNGAPEDFLNSLEQVLAERRQQLDC